MSREKIITGIDIGSTKITTVVASVSDNKVSVIGVSGNIPSKGINKGNVVDIDSSVEAISQSIEKAERMYGDEGSECYEETWASDGRGGYKWVVTPSLNLNIQTYTVKSKKRKLKMKWTVEADQQIKKRGKK